MLTSMVCKFADFSEEWYSVQEKNLQIRQIYSYHSASRHDFVNRKFWEWCAMCQALEEREKLWEGRRGLGFAVGTEPLASYFASKGCSILATDLDESDADAGWTTTGQHAASLRALHHPLLIDAEPFERRVNFLPADMRNLDGFPDCDFDFVWSSCALEHLGTLQHGLDFILKSASLLKVGGVAVHTTEFNVGSDHRTVESGSNVIYRRRDILRLAQDLRNHGFSLATPNFASGHHSFDLDFDSSPYMESDRRHIKLLIEGYVTTSLLIIVERIGT